MVEDLLEQAKAWRQEADALLAESGLPQVLERVGTVQYTGSYDYDVLLGPDVDIYVLVPDAQAKESARTALDTLIEQNYWNGYLYYDFAVHPSVHHPGFPESYYVGVKGDFRGHRWKVDIWFGPSDVLYANNAWIKPLLADENRPVILALKHARNEGELHAESHEIYTAVLKDGVRDAAGFLTWQQERGRQ